MTTSNLGTRLTGYVVAYYTDGDEANLTPFFELVQSFLLRRSYQEFLVRCPAQRADLVQGVLERLLETLRRQQFTPPLLLDGTPASMLSWLLRLHKNYFINEYHATEKNPAHPGREEPEYAFHIPAGSDETEAQEEAQLLLERVLRQAQQLPKRQELVFRLFYLDGVPYRQGAEQIGISEGAFKSILNAAMQKLRSWAQQQPSPSADLYAAFKGLTTHTNFQDGPAHHRAQIGYYSNGNAGRRSKQKANLQKSFPTARRGRPAAPRPTIIPTP